MESGGLTNACRRSGRAGWRAAWLLAVVLAVLPPAASPPDLIPVERCVKEYVACACQQSGTEFICVGFGPKRVPTADVLRELLRVVPRMVGPP